MRIVLDARKYFDFGIGTYIQNLVFHLKSKVEWILLIAPEDTQRIDELADIQKKTNSAGKYSLQELRSIAVDANALSADVFHAPHYTTPYGLAMPSVTTIHDILHVRGKKYFSPLKRLYARTIIGHACRSSDAIIVDSEFTKQELMDAFPVSEDRIHVVHLGVSAGYGKKYPPAAIRDFRAKHGLVKPTIFYTGSLKPHKNVGTLISAFAHLQHRAEFQLAFSGEPITKHRELWSSIKDNKMEGEVVEIGQISRNDLAVAYQAASVVVLPSLYEGFGFSVLEAMASGIPTIGAAAGSIPEVMGDGGVLFDPSSDADLTDALEKVLHDTELQKQLVARGWKNVERFSWEQCADRTLQLYKDIQ
jgi:glycosyltransferase involved in cell wall biosynthesis